MKTLIKHVLLVLYQTRVGLASYHPRSQWPLDVTKMIEIAELIMAA